MDEDELNAPIDKIVKATSGAVIETLIKSGAIRVPQYKRKRTAWERILVKEYIQANYANVPHWIRVEVGPIPGTDNPLLFSRLRRWADAVIIMPDHILVIEAKMKADVNVIGQLLLYASLVPQTPLFARYAKLPVKAKVVTAMITDEVRRAIESAGIEVEVFKPSNFEQWYAEKILKGGYSGAKIKREEQEQERQEYIAETQKMLGFTEQ